MRWIKDHIWLVALVLIAIVTFVVAVLVRRKDAGSLEGLVREIKLEKQVIDEKAATAKLVATSGHAKATEVIKQHHEARLAKMDEEAKKKVEELSNDPEALVEHLLRATV